MPRPLSEEAVAEFKHGIQAIIDKRQSPSLVAVQRFIRRRKSKDKPSTKEVEMLKRSLGL